MHLRIKGKPKKVPVSLCKIATKWYAKKLLTEKTYKEIYVDLEFNTNDLACDEDGAVVWNDTNIRGRDYTMTIRPNLGIRSTLLSIAHEMVHVKQYAHGELVDYIHSSKTNKCRWRGKIRNNYDNPIEYWDMPWEIEAHGWEKGLYYQFLAHHQEYQKLFKRKRRKK